MGVGARFAHLFDEPPRRDVVRTKSDSAVFGRSAYQILAEQIVRQAVRLDEREYGVPYTTQGDKPVGGAVEVVTPKDVNDSMAMLKDNGLNLAESKTALIFSHRPAQVPTTGITLGPAPIASKPLLELPEKSDEEAQLIMRILIIDPEFTGTPTGHLPEKYSESILNNFNPLALFAVYAKYFGKTPAEGLLFRFFGNNNRAFYQIAASAAKQWRDTPDKKAIAAAIAKDRSRVLGDLISQAVLHEEVHGLAFHMPDQLPAGLSAEERAEFEAFSYGAYERQLFADDAIRSSCIFSKNMWHAVTYALKLLTGGKSLDELDETEMQKLVAHVEKVGVPKQAQDLVNVRIALECLCDRFAMFLYENSLKVRILRNELQALGVALPVDVNMLVSVDSYRHHKDRNLRDHPSLKQASDAQIQAVDAKLTEAEGAHVYISDFKDPRIQPWEYGVYGGLLNWLRQLESEGQVFQFTMEHARSSRIISASVMNLPTISNNLWPKTEQDQDIARETIGST